jgi:carbon storage regulator
VLVLTRKPGESIMIGDDIELVVLGLDGQKVRIGVHAPASVPVHRQEVYLAIRSREGERGDGEQPRMPRAGRRAG